MRIARGTQRPGQTKEQTKLIAQGIQKGIDQYKKTHKAKARELDKKLKRAAAQLDKSNQARAEPMEVIPSKPRLIPWVLLIASWVGFIGFLLFK